MILDVKLGCDHEGCQKVLIWSRPTPFVYLGDWDVEGHWNDRDELVIGKAYCPDHVLRMGENRPTSEEMVNKLAEDIRAGLWKAEGEQDPIPDELGAERMRQMGAQFPSSSSEKMVE